MNLVSRYWPLAAAVLAIIIIAMIAFWYRP